MKGKSLLLLTISLLLVLGLGGGIGGLWAKEPEAPGEGPLATALGTAFTYQGRLMDGDSPANGQYDFQFKLYDAAIGGNTVGSPVLVDNQLVEDGLFTVQLDFGDVFDGTALWLEIGVRPGASGDPHTILDPRQPLTATPYALYARSIPLAGSGSATTAARSDHDHWGASWSGSGIGLTLESSNGTGLAAQGAAYGVYGRSNSTTGVGVVGEASNNTGTNYGVYGQSISTSGTGVYGYASATSGTNYGIYGKSNSINGYGVYGEAPWHGVKGMATSATDTTYGVIGIANSTTSGTGVYGYAPWNGVLGETSSASGRGVYGYASSATGTTYGVYGQSSSTGGYGVYASGGAGDLRLSGTGTIYANEGTASDLALHSNDYIDLHLDDDNNSTSLFRVFNGANTTVFSVDETGAVSWAAQIGYVSVSAAAFRPQVDGYDFYNNGLWVENEDDLSDYYYAPVQLPHGAMVTRMTFYWGDWSSSNGSASMVQNNMARGAFQMAYAATSGSGGDGSSYDDTISSATIDNSQYSYYLLWVLPDSDVLGCGVIIEYTYTRPY